MRGGGGAGGVFCEDREGEGVLVADWRSCGGSELRRGVGRVCGPARVIPGTAGGCPGRVGGAGSPESPRRPRGYIEGRAQATRGNGFLVANSPPVEARPGGRRARRKGMRGPGSASVTQVRIVRATLGSNPGTPWSLDAEVTRGPFEVTPRAFRRAKTRRTPGSLPRNTHAQRPSPQVEPGRV